MKSRLIIHPAIRKVIDNLTRTAHKTADLEGTCFGARELGILIVATACMVIMAANARAALKDNPPQGVTQAPFVSGSAQRLLNKAKRESTARNHSAVVEMLSTVMRMPLLPQVARATILLDRGNAYLHLGETNKAIVDFDASLKFSHPEPERVYLLRGMAYEKQGKLGQAAWSYIQAVNAAPTNEVINHHVMRFFNKP